ncbi:hypothetical protein MBLNU230_g2297t1 [Neophaeotheca triangularis]
MSPPKRDGEVLHHVNGENYNDLYSGLVDPNNSGHSVVNNTNTGINFNTSMLSTRRQVAGRLPSYRLKSYYLGNNDDLYQQQQRRVRDGMSQSSFDDPKSVSHRMAVSISTHGSLLAPASQNPFEEFIHQDQFEDAGRNDTQSQDHLEPNFQRPNTTFQTPSHPVQKQVHSMSSYLPIAAASTTALHHPQVNVASIPRPPKPDNMTFGSLLQGKAFWEPTNLLAVPTDKDDISVVIANQWQHVENLARALSSKEFKAAPNTWFDTTGALTDNEKAAWAKWQTNACKRAANVLAKKQKKGVELSFIHFTALKIFEAVLELHYHGTTLESVDMEKEIPASERLDTVTSVLSEYAIVRFDTLNDGYRIERLVAGPNKLVIKKIDFMTSNGKRDGKFAAKSPGPRKRKAPEDTDGDRGESSVKRHKKGSECEPALKRTDKSFGVLSRAAGTISSSQIGRGGLKQHGIHGLPRSGPLAHGSHRYEQQAQAESDMEHSHETTRAPILLNAEAQGDVYGHNIQHHHTMAGNPPYFGKGGPSGPVLGFMQPFWPEGDAVAGAERVVGGIADGATANGTKLDSARVDVIGLRLGHASLGLHWWC